MKLPFPFIGDWFKGYYQYLFVLVYPCFGYFSCYFDVLLLFVVCLIRGIEFWQLFIVGCGGVDSGEECVDGGDSDSEE